MACRGTDLVHFLSVSACHYKARQLRPPYDVTVKSQTAGHLALCAAFYAYNYSAPNCFAGKLKSVRLKVNWLILAEVFTHTIYSRASRVIQLVLKYTLSHQTRVGVVLPQSVQKSKMAKKE